MFEKKAKSTNVTPARPERWNMNNFFKKIYFPFLVLQIIIKKARLTIIQVVHF